MENNNLQYQGQSYYGQQQGAPNLAKPDSNLVWGIVAILSTFFCGAFLCLPFGVASIIKALKVDSLWSAGRYQEAYDAAKSAKKWALAGIILYVAAVIISIIIYIV